MMLLPKVQADAILDTFEKFFDDDEIYLDLVDLDEVFNSLLGNDISQDLIDRIKETSKIDEFNFSFVVMLGELMNTLERESAQLEFYELAYNCKQLKIKINEIICTSNCDNLSQC
jgi:uncharacterized protein YfeS